MPGLIRPDSTTDPALVAAYRNGDERAAAELVARHAAALGRFLYSLGADRDELEDLVQETLFRAFRRVESWRGGASFRSWLVDHRQQPSAGPGSKAKGSAGVDRRPRHPRSSRSRARISPPARRKTG